VTQPFEAFAYKDGVLHAGEIPVPEIADAVGTPTYVYSADAIRSNYRRIERAFAPLGARLHYAVKASSNLHLLRLLREQGAGMDVVSGGELERAWLAGAPMADIVFAGVGGSRWTVEPPCRRCQAPGWQEHRDAGTRRPLQCGI